MKGVRSFIAVFLDPATRARVAAFQERLAGTGADVKWVEPHNLHLTLKFLGDVEPTRLDEIGRALEAAASGTRQFELGIAGAGVFPNARNPRVVWLGVREGREALLDLARRVEHAMEALGFPRDEKGFSPHLTIGRVRSPRNAQALVREATAVGAAPEASVRVARVELESSTLAPQGPTYSPVRVVELAAALAAAPLSPRPR